MLLAGIALSSCGGNVESSTGPGPSGIPRNRRASDLDDAELRRLCEWQKEQLAEGNCLQNALLIGGFESGPISEDPSSIERARATCNAELAECLQRLARPEDVEECTARAREQFAKCDVSVADIEECTVDYAVVYAGMPPCSALTVDVFRQVLYTFAPPSCEKAKCG